MREDRDSLVERLHRQTAEYSAFKLENERLKVWGLSWGSRVGLGAGGGTQIPTCQAPQWTLAVTPNAI